LKQHRNPFEATQSSAKQIAERFHSDVCGPFTLSNGGSQYFVTFLDEISHYLFIYTVPKKLSATMKATFEKFVKLAENQSGKKVKIIRSDGGGEYLGELTPFLEAMGIIHETTAPYTAQSNGKAERVNRTINESVRSMLYYANLPESFWAEAVTTAAYTWTRLPSSAIDDQIPFELWFRRPLYQDDIRRLRTFGCIVYAHVPKQRRVGKLSYRSTRGCLVGYHSSTSYKYWDFDRKCFETSHDLIIKELEFPVAADFDEDTISVSQAPR